MARLGLFWICATILFGCSLGGTTGELGNLAFWDETDNPEWLDLDHKVDRPIAQGAFIDITIKDAVNLNDLRNAKGGKVHSVNSATVDPSGVLSVVSTGEYVRLKADAVGSAKLNVITNGGIEDRVALEVAAVAKCGDLTVMHGSTVNLLLTVPEKMAPKGYALLPGGTANLGIKFYDSQQRELTGHGVAGWKVDDGSLVELKPHNERSNRVVVKSIGTAGGVATVSSIKDCAFKAVLAQSGSTDKLTLHDYFTRAPLAGGKIEVEESGVALVGVFAYDKEGRFLVGLDGTGFEVSVADPTLAGHGEHDAAGKAVETNKQLTEQRVLQVAGLAVGSTTITVKTLGKTVEIPVVVSPKSSANDLDD